MKMISNTSLYFMTFQLTDSEKKQVEEIATALGISEEDALKQAVDFFCAEGVKHLDNHKKVVA